MQTIHKLKSRPSFPVKYIYFVKEGNAVPVVGNVELKRPLVEVLPECHSWIRVFLIKGKEAMEVHGEAIKAEDLDAWYTISENSAKGDAILAYIGV